MMGALVYLGGFVYHLFNAGTISFLFIAIIRFFYPKVHTGWLVLLSVGIGYWYAFVFFDWGFHFSDLLIHFLNIIYMPIVTFSAIMFVKFLKHVKRKGDAVEEFTYKEEE